ncbi:MAG: hypothetical protein ACI4GY_00020 [Acutalibacteraceae bacterium]
MKFGELLKTCLEQNNVSTNRFSRKSGINSATVYNIFSSQRKMPEDKFLSCMKLGLFSKKQREKLYECFYREKYGDEQYECVKFLFEFFGSQKTAYKNIVDAVESFELKVGQDAALSNHDSILSCQKTFFESVSDNQIVYTNYSFQNEDIDSITYYFVKKNNVRLFHFRSDADRVELLERTKMFVGLDKYYELGVNFYRAPDFSDKSNSETKGAFPFYFAKEDFVLIYSIGAKLGFASRNKDFCKAFISEVKKITENSYETSNFPTDLLQMMNLKGDLKDFDRHIALGALSYCAFSDADTLLENVNENFSLKDLCPQTIVDYLNKFNCYFMITVDELERFAKSGRNYDVPTDILNSYNPDSRVKTLGNIIKAVEKEQIYIVDSSYQKYKLHNCYMFNENNACNIGILFNLPDEKKCIGQYVAFGNSDEQIAEVFMNYFDFIKKTGCVIDKEKAKLLIENLILKCEIESDDNYKSNILTF